MPHGSNESLPLSPIYVSFHGSKSLEPAADWFFFSHPFIPSTSMILPFTSRCIFTSSTFGKLFFWHWKMQEMRQRGPTIGPVVDQQLLGRNDLLHTLNVSLIVLQAHLLSGCIVRLCLILGMVYEMAPPWPHASTILMIKGPAVSKWFMRMLVAMLEVHVVVEPAFSIGNRQQKFGLRKGCHDFLVKEHVWFIHGCVKSTQGGKRIIQWAIARSIAKKIST